MSGSGLGKTFAMAFRGGATVGLAVPAMALLAITGLYMIYPDPITIVDVGIGASLIALFIRIGGGNGRATRLMMNHVLNTFDYPLMDIDYEDRRSYYTALENSQRKDNDLPFLQWFMKRYVKTHKKYLN